MWIDTFKSKNSSTLFYAYLVRIRLGRKIKIRTLYLIKKNYFSTIHFQWIPQWNISVTHSLPMLRLQRQFDMFYRTAISARHEFWPVCSNALRRLSFFPTKLVKIFFLMILWKRKCGKNSKNKKKIKKNKKKMKKKQKNI